MSGLLSISMNRRNVLLSSAVAFLILVATVTVVVRAMRDGGDASPQNRSYRVKVEHVRSGHKVKLKSGKSLLYAGMRAPHPSEELYEESRRRNAELVEGKTVRLRFDKKEYDKKGHLRAYVFADGDFVNETLIREGLAYVRLIPGERRFADQLLAAQSEARRHRRGLWRHGVKSSEPSYAADTKYGAFHRPTCSVAEKIKPDRLRVFKKKREAIDAGFAPCAKCLP